MEEKLSGIVLSGVSIGEYDKILNIFTLEKGVVSAKIKGVKKAGAKLKFASEPFCFAEFMFSKTQSKRTVIGASLIESFYELRADIVKYYAGATILETVKKFSMEGIVNQNLFVLTIDSLKGICFTNKSPALAVIKYLTSALKLLGYGLNLNGCAECGKVINGKTYFDYASGAFYCENCFFGTGKEINNQTFLTLNGIENGENTTENLVKPLMLLDYYLVHKTEENILSLKEFIKIVG